MIEQLRWTIELKFRTFFGRLFHGGISKPDLWNVDSFLAPKIAKVVKRFAEMDKIGIPCGLVEEYEEGDYVLEIEPIWNAILWKMVDGFERMSDDEYCCRADLKYEQECLDLFAEFFINLWD